MHTYIPSLPEVLPRFHRLDHDVRQAAISVALVSRKLNGKGSASAAQDWSITIHKGPSGMETTPHQPPHFVAVSNWL